MTPESTSRRFTPDEVNAILRRALERQGVGAGSVSYDDLLETARELGIDPESVAGALVEQDEVGVLDSARERWTKMRKKKFYEHLRSYLIINLFLFIVDIAATHGTWFWWVLCGWGIGLMFDASDTFFPKERDIERGVRKMLDRERRQRTKGIQFGHGDKRVTIDGQAGRIVIEKGGKRIEIG